MLFIRTEKTFTHSDMMLLSEICLSSVLEIKKVLTKSSKEKGCEIIGRWKKAWIRHFYSVYFTTDAVPNYTLIDAEVQEMLNPSKRKQRIRPVCRKCGKPRKGHKKGQCSDEP